MIPTRTRNERLVSVLLCYAYTGHRGCCSKESVVTLRPREIRKTINKQYSASSINRRHVAAHLQIQEAKVSFVLGRRLQKQGRQVDGSDR